MILKSILKQTGSQCRDFKIGVMCALFLVLVNTRAAEFWSSCSCVRQLIKACIRVSILALESNGHTLAMFFR